MRWRSRQIVLTFVGGAVLLGATLLLVNLLAPDVFLVLFVPSGFGEEGQPLKLLGHLPASFDAARKTPVTVGRHS